MNSGNSFARNACSNYNSNKSWITFRDRIACILDRGTKHLLPGLLCYICSQLFHNYSSPSTLAGVASSNAEFQVP